MCTFSTSERQKRLKTQFLHFWLRNVVRATASCIFSTSERQKSGPSMWCFVHFDLEMCFVPQRRALFRHLNFQKWSDVRVLYILTWKCASRHNGVHFCRHFNFKKWPGPGVFCTFWLGNVLRAATACNFSSLIWPAGSAPVALANLLFDPPEIPEPQIIGKNTVNGDFPSFSCRLHLLSLIFSLLGFSSLILPTPTFPSVHIVGSLTSKLPSIIYLSTYLAI